MQTLYQEDLAYIHAAAFGGLARGAAPEIIRRLKSAPAPIRRVVDAGCGAGLLSAALEQAGFEVTGIDASRELLSFAGAAAPKSRFIHASLFEIELPACDAVLAIGEPLTYESSDDLLEEFVSKARAALPLGGVLIFDVIETGEPPLAGRFWSSGEDWAVLVDTAEQDSTLTRSIETFRRVDDNYRRSHEIHRVHLFDTAHVRALLSRCGFSVETGRAFGEYALATRRRAFFCERTRH